MLLGYMDKRLIGVSQTPRTPLNAGTKGNGENMDKKNKKRRKTSSIWP